MVVDGSRSGIPFRTGALVVFGCSLAALLAGSASAVDPTFTASSFATGSSAISVVAANLNADGFADLAVTNQGGGDVSILLGNGSGGFSTAGSIAVGVRAVARR